MPHNDEIEVRLWLYPLIVTYNLIWTFVYNASTLNYLQIENLEKWKRAIISLLLLRLLFGLWNCILESSSLFIGVHSSIVLNVNSRQACCNTELKRLKPLKHVESRFLYLFIKPIWSPICGLFIHSFIHILSFPLILFLLNPLCFSFKFVERFLSCILQNGISGDDVPPQGGRTQRRPTGQEREKCESTILLEESISCDKIISQRLNTHFGGSVLYQTNNLVQIKYLLILIFTFHTL